MYARVASFEGRDSSLTDQLIQRVQDQGPSSVPDAKGFLGFFHRERGTSLGITFFDSEEAIRNSEQAFEDMARDFPSEMRGRRPRSTSTKSRSSRATPSVQRRPASAPSKDHPTASTRASAR